MAAQKRVRQMIGHYLEKLAKRLNVRKAVLFGSHARGEARKDSDIDLIVVSKDFESMPFLTRLEMLSLEWDFGKAADIIGYTPKEYRELAARSTVVHQAQKEGIQLHPAR